MVEEQKHMSRYLREYGTDSEYLERLVVSAFADEYPKIFQGAPAGGRDLGIDALCIGGDGAATVWCVTAHKIKGLQAKLVGDGKAVFENLHRHGASTLREIFFCTTSKISPALWSAVIKQLETERERLVSQGATGLGELVLRKFDCDSLALVLSQKPNLERLKRELQEKMKRGLGIPGDLPFPLTAIVSNEEEPCEGVIELSGEWDEEDLRWSEKLFSDLISQYSNLEDHNNETLLLLGIDSIMRLAFSTTTMSFGAREKIIPERQQILNMTVWPRLHSAWRKNCYEEFDVRLVGCFVYVNLLLSNRAFTLTVDEVSKSHVFTVENSESELLRESSIMFRLISLLMSLNHRLLFFDRNEELIRISNALLACETSKTFSAEQRLLFDSIATLYIHALKYWDGPDSYRQKLRSCYENGFDHMDFGFWHSSFQLLILLYSRETSADWAAKRKAFQDGFELLKIELLKTPRQALLYMELYSRYLELCQVGGLDAMNKKSEALDQLRKQVGKDIRIRIYSILLRIRACFVCPWHELPDRFLALEKLVDRTSGLGSLWGLLIRLRLLYLFLLRVSDPRVIEHERMFESSKLVAYIACQDEKSLRTWFGVADFRGESTQTGQKRQIDFGYARGVMRQLAQDGLSCYANVILANRNLPRGVLVRSSLDYLDLLTYASSVFPSIPVSNAFHSLLRVIEEAARKQASLHYYLARIYSKHYMRDLPKALSYYRAFWSHASDLEKNRFASAYAKTLYEHHMYEENLSDDASTAQPNSSTLQTLLKVGNGFIGCGSKRYFISCYYGLGLSVSQGDSSQETVFLNRMVDKLWNLLLSRAVKMHREEEMLNTTIYSEEFHAFLKDSQTYVANALLVSLNSPEIYNMIGTHLFNLSRQKSDTKATAAIRLLYDISIALARGQEYYLPKYEFNRVRFDVASMIADKGPKDESQTEALATNISVLHRLCPKFPWARRFLIKDVCKYLIENRSNPFVSSVLKDQNFDTHWHSLRSAVASARRRAGIS